MVTVKSDVLRSQQLQIRFTQEGSRLSKLAGVIPRHVGFSFSFSIVTQWDSLLQESLFLVRE